MLDKATVYNILAEGMHFFGQKYIKFQLFGLSTAFLKLFKFLQFLKPALVYLDFAPFYNFLATKT